MNSTKSFALQMHRDAIVSDLVVDNIIDKLLSKFVIDEEDKGLIDKENNEKDKARRLLDILVVKTDETYDIFREILEPDYDWLAKLLIFDNSSEWIKTIQQDALTIGGVPREPPYYVERKHILETIRNNLLEMKRSNFLMLHGMPGSGKSCLARSAICDSDVLSKMSNRVYWCNVGECTTPELIQQHLYKLYIKIQNDITNRSSRPVSVLMSEKLVDHLHDTLKAIFVRNEFRNSLLVLDDVRDCETLDMFDLGCKILITSKNKEVLSNIRSEDAKIIHVPDFTETESIQLFSNCMGIKLETLTPQQTGHLKTIHNLCRGLPMVVALIGGQLKLSYNMEETRVERMEDCIQRLKNHGDFFSSNKIFPAIDICIKDLPEGLREKFHHMAIFLEDVNIPSSVLQMLWGESKYCVEDIMTELKNRSLVLGEFNVENREFVYGLHDLLLAYLKHRLSKTDIQNMHTKLIETYRQKCNGDFSKLPRDNYIYSYLGYHFEESNQPLPDIYLDLNFIGAKIRATSSADLLVDFKRYEDKIVKNDPNRKAQLKEMEEFVKDYSYDLYRYPDLCVVQLALTWKTSGHLKALAQNIIQKQPDRLFLDVWCKEKGPPRPQIVDLPSVPMVASFTIIDTNQILIGFENGYIQMWDLNYYRVCANFEGHKNSVHCLKVNPMGDNFVSLSESGEGHLWNIPTNLPHSNSIAEGAMNGSPSPVVRQKPWHSLHETDNSKYSALHNFEFDPEKAFKFACYSSTGELVCLCSENGFINVHDVLNGRTIAVLNTGIENIISCCFYKKTYIMLAAANNDIWLFDLKNEIMGKFQCAENSICLLTTRFGEVLCVTPTTIGYFCSQEIVVLIKDVKCTCACITPDGDILVVGNQDSITVYEIKYDDADEIHALEMMHFIPDLSGVVTSVDTYQNGPCIYILVSNKTETQIKIWCLQPGDFTTDYNKTARRLPIFDCIFDPLPVTPDAKDVMKSVIQQLSNMDPTKLGNMLYSYSPNSPRHININYQLVVADSSYKLQIQRGHSVTNSENYPTKITCITISACGLIIAYGFDNGFICIYETKTKTSRKVLKLPSCVSYLEFFNNLILTAADDLGTLMVWAHDRPYKLQEDIKILQEKSNVPNESSEKVVRCFEFAAHIISVSENVSVKLWDFIDKDHKLLSVLWGKHSTNSKVTCCSLKDKYLALGQDDGTFMYFYINSKDDIRQLKVQCKELSNITKPIQSLDLSPDGKIIALGLNNGDIILWSTESNAVLTTFKLHKTGVTYLSFAPNFNDVSPLILLSTSDVLAWWNVSYCLKRHFTTTKSKRPRKKSQVDNEKFSNGNGLELKNIANPDRWFDKVGPNWRPELMICVKLQGKYAFRVVANSSFSAFVTVDESGQFYLMRLK